MNNVSDYFSGVSELLNAIDEPAVNRLLDRLEEAWRTGRKVLLLGNGGSSATASHIVNDLQKCIHLESGRPLKALSLSDCTPLILAWGNDTEFANIFSPQVECWAEPGDLVIAISGSGNSPNVIRAVETANRIGASTFGLAGFEGGALVRAANDCIVISSDNMQHIEDLHMILLHSVFSILRERTRGTLHAEISR